MSDYQFQGSTVVSSDVSGQEKPDVLFLLHLPPPVHGSSIVGQAVMGSVLVNQVFNCRFINLLASRTVGASGKLSFSKLFGFLSLIFKLLGQLTSRRPNLCYFALTTTGFAFFRDAMLCILIKLARVPIVFHLHNKGVARKSTSRLYRLAYRFVFNNAQVIILSEHLFPDIASFVPKHRVHVCANGIPDEALGTLGPKPRNACVSILFLSNLVASKGAIDLIAACALLRNRGVEFNCTFVGAEGDISRQTFLEAIKRLSLESRIQYLGPKFGVKKQECFRSADIFALPTYYECFPLVVLEAMSYFLPIVSCPEGGIPDQVDESVSGFLVPQRDVERLADRLEQLIKDEPLRTRMGIAGRERYVAKFTDHAFEARLVAILQSVGGVAS